MKDFLFVKNINLYAFGTKNPNSMSHEKWGFEHFVDESIYKLIHHETHTRIMWEMLSPYMLLK